MEYRIGSFNMKNFGANSAKDFEKIAEIIVGEQLDVVALQEILSEGKGVQRLLEESVEHELYNWDFCCATPRESSDIEKLRDMVVNDTRGECYAFLWNTKRFKKVEFSKLGKKRVFEPRILNSLSTDVNVDCSLFARAPYYIRLQPRFGGFFELRLINIHIYWGDSTLSSIDKRKIEFDVLTREIYPEISATRYGQNRTPYTIAMGDYNLNIFRPFIQTQAKNSNLTEVQSYWDGQRQVQILTIQDQLTTLRDVDRLASSDFDVNNPLANNYDHFTYSPELSDFADVKYKTIDAVNKYCEGDYSYYRKYISDHLPIVMTVTI